MTASTQFEPSGTPIRRRLRVLIADDERDTVLTLTAILEDAGHEAKGVHDARAALGAIADFDPDVVLADIAMPGSA